MGDAGDQVVEPNTTFSFVLLDPDLHDREAFCCGEATLDCYLKTQATQDIRRGYSACFVAATSEGLIAGYYTLSAYSVQVDDLPVGTTKRLPKQAPVPSALLGRLAVDEKFKGQGLGGALLADALNQAANAPTAAFALVVDALNAKAGEFYIHHGFIGFASAPNRYFLPLAPFRG